MANPAEQPDSLDTEMTRAGDLRGKPAPAPQPDISLGDLGTNADIAGSISDLGGAGAAFDESAEIVDLAKRYEIGPTLGRGGMGHVVQAVDRKLKRPVAIKQLLAEYSGSSKAWQRFLTEAQSIAALSHFNIIQIFDYGLTREGPFLVMEFVDGPSLSGRISNEPLEKSEAVEIAAQLAEALHVAHQRGIVHRDIKPANVLLTSTGTPKLGDFGLARQDDSDASQYTQAGAVLGTLDYMSPEQRRDASQADARSDQWSLAATLYELLTGDVPRVIRPDRLPESLRDVVMQALEDDPAKRFSDGQAFADALRQAGAAAASSQATGDRSTLKTGQCIHCQTINDPANTFCESCGQGLKEPCLQCEAPVGVWAQFCPQCGTDQAALLQSQLAKLTAERQEIEALRRSYHHEEALTRLAPICALERSEFSELQEWAQSATERYRTEFEQLTAQRDGILTEARERSSAGELSAAIKLLEGLPEPLRTSEAQQLLDGATARRDELKELSQRIRKAVKERAYDGLLLDVERFLELRPDDAQAQKMRDRLQQREQQQRDRAAAAAEDEFGDGDEYGYDSDDSSSSDGQPLRRSRRLSGQGKQAAQRKRLLIGGGLLATLLLTIGLGFLGGDGEPDLAETDSTASVHDASDPAAETTPQRANGGESGEGPTLADADSTGSDTEEVVGTTLAETTPLRANGNEVTGTPQADTRDEGLNQPPIKPPLATAPFDATQAKAHQQAWADYLGVPAKSANSIGMQFVVIPPGEFTMGSPEDERDRKDTETLHKVTLTQPFLMGMYEVTQEQYQNVMGTNPSNFTGPFNPVESVPWSEAVEFCRKLSALPAEKSAGHVYRLPTEAEWEHACRAGTTTKYSFDDSVGRPGDYAWYGENSQSATHLVGRKKPNGWGLYDIHGNVWEWCQDLYGEYPGGAYTDPTGPAAGPDHVRRGGSWLNGSNGCRSAYRGWGTPGDYSALGFRVVRTQTQRASVTTASTSSAESDNWRSLYNGRDLTGWVPEVPPGGEGNPQTDWSAGDGAISSLGVGHNWLASEEEFENFTLTFDWRFPTGFQQGVNGSGVVVGVNGLNSILFDPKGIEIDLLPTRQGRPTGTLITYDTALVHAGGVGSRLGNGTFEPTGDWIRPAGQWNSGTIKCQGNTLTVEINGHEVNSGTAPAGVRGKICLRNQKSRVEFRNLRIKTDQPAPPAESESEASWFDLLNGTDLTGWTAKTASPSSVFEAGPETTVQASGESGVLWTDARHRDFELALEWKFPAGQRSIGSGSGIVLGKMGTGTEWFPDGGLEVQLHASNSGEFFLLDEKPYRRITRASDVDAPVGEWNRLLISRSGKRVEVSVNEITVNSLAEAVSGPVNIGLMSQQQNAIQFRRIRIRDLDSPATAASSPAATDPNIESPQQARKPVPPKDRALFDRVSLEGWSVGYVGYTKARTPHRWSAKFGRIVCSGEDQDYLITSESFRNYVLEVDWRFPASGPRTPNGSGVVIHCSGTNFEDNPQGYEINLPAVSRKQQLANRGKGGVNVTGGVITYGVTAENHSGTATGVRSENRQLKVFSVPPLKPDGSNQFNRLKVIVIENTVQVWVNDTIVNDVWNLNTTAGRIALRSQGTAIEFSRVAIRELTGKTKAEMQQQLR